MSRSTVATVMTREVVTVTPETPYKEIVQLLAEHKISGVPVVDAEDRVLGVISEADLLTKKEFHDGPRGLWSRLTRRGRLARRKAAATVAGDLMSAPPVTVRPETTIVAAARVMDSHRIKRLPVVDEAGRIIGVVSRPDLLRVFLRSDEEIRRQVVTDVFERSLWMNPALVHVTVSDGVVTLEGTLERKTLIPLAVSLTQAVDGVVDVIDRLKFDVDDTKISDATAERWRQRVG